jgi:hypothetical protein
MASRTSSSAARIGSGRKGPRFVSRPAVDAERRVPESLEQLAVPVAELRLCERNPRRGDTRAIRESLERNGQYRPIVVNRRTMEVLAGNHTLRAAIELGWEEIAATFVDVDDEQARRIVLVDNRTNDLAGYDTALLAELLEELPDLEGTGYDLAAVDALPIRRASLRSEWTRAEPRAGRGALLGQRAGRHRACADRGLIQRATCEEGLLGASRLTNTTERVTNGGPSSWQSKAAASACDQGSESSG